MVRHSCMSLHYAKNLLPYTDFARSAFQRIKVSLINTQPYTVTYIVGDN